MMKLILIETSTVNEIKSYSKAQLVREWELQNSKRVEVSQYNYIYNKMQPLETGIVTLITFEHESSITHCLVKDPKKYLQSEEELRREWNYLNFYKVEGEDLCQLLQGRV